LTRQLQERLSLLGAIVALLAFGITYGKTVDPLTALGMVGLAYLASGPVVLYIIYRGGREDELSYPFPLLLLGMIPSYALLAWYMSSVDWSMHAVVLLVFGGIALLALPPSLIGLAILRYRERHKTCPECANEVLSAARVCQHCGYRWQPPLSRPSLPSDGRETAQ
jgi:hypothetical protein